MTTIGIPTLAFILHRKDNKRFTAGYIIKQIIKRAKETSSIVFFFIFFLTTQYILKNETEVIPNHKSKHPLHNHYQK